MDHTSSRFKHYDMLLAFVITVVAISAIKVVQLNVSLGVNWFVAPGILVVAALIPKLVKKERLCNAALSSEQIKSSFVVLSWTCLSVLPAMFCGLWFLKFYGLSFPLRPILAQDQRLVNWLFYQFMYVAVAEEIFFRGFLQSSILSFFVIAIPKRRSLQCCLSVIISAGCFALAHMVIHESALSVLIIAPGLILGWLYIKTGSLLAPILFHGIANATYYFLSQAMVG